MHVPFGRSGSATRINPPQAAAGYFEPAAGNTLHRTRIAIIAPRRRTTRGRRATPGNGRAAVAPHRVADATLAPPARAGTSSRVRAGAGLSRTDADDALATARRTPSAPFARPAHTAAAKERRTRQDRHARTLAPAGRVMSAGRTRGPPPHAATPAPTSRARAARTSPVEATARHDPAGSGAQGRVPAPLVGAAADHVARKRGATARSALVSQESGWATQVARIGRSSAEPSCASNRATSPIPARP